MHDSLSLVTLAPEHVLLSIYNKAADWRRAKSVSNLYLDHVGRDAVPQGEDALVFDNLDEAVGHSAEMDVDSTQMWEVCALSLKQGERGKEVLN